MIENETKNQETEGVCTQIPTSHRQKISLKKRFSAKRIAFMAVFVALSFAVSLLEIPMPLFGASFLKLDFGNVFIILISFLLGPVEGVLVCLLKESLRCIGSTSMCAGELANFVVTSTYLLLPSVCYHFRRTFSTVLITLSVSCVLAAGMALVVNRFLIFPAYAELMGGTIFGMNVKSAFTKFWIAILLFNLIKTTAISILTLLMYKRLSNFLKKMKI